MVEPGKVDDGRDAAEQEDDDAEHEQLVGDHAAPHAAHDGARTVKRRVDASQLLVEHTT